MKHQAKLENLKIMKIKRNNASLNSQDVCGEIPTNISKSNESEKESSQRYNNANATEMQNQR